MTNLQPSPSRPSPTQSRVAVVRTRHQFQVIATEAIRRGEPVLPIDGVVVPVPSRFSVQVGPHEHVELPAEVTLEEAMDHHPWRFLNHSCAPNAFLRGRTLLARTDIPAFAEVTFDYHTTEWDLASPFPCGCGARDCVGVVRGFRHLLPARRRALRPWLADHLRVREEQDGGGSTGG